MKTAKTLAVLLALGTAAATGCATDSSGGPGDTGGDNGGGDDGGGDDVDPIPATLAAKYQVTSSFDLAAGMPGQVGEITQTFIDATDDANDPANYLVGLAINGISNNTIRSILQGAQPIIAGYVQDKINDIAPTFVTKMLAVSNHFGDAMRNFGTLSTLEPVASGGAYVATHTVYGLRFKIDTNYLDFPFADYTSYDMQNIVASGIAVDLADSGKVTIARHELPMSFGRIANIALDEVVIPAVDADSHNLGDLMENTIDCAALGQSIADAADSFFVQPSVVEAACHAGITVAVNQLYTKLDNMDTQALLFQIDGVAKAVDSAGNDGVADDIRTGAWGGDMSYAGNASNLASTDAFYGSKM